MSWLNLLGLLLVNCSTVYILVQSIVSRSLKQEVMRLLYQQKARGRVGFLCRTQSSWQEDALFYPSLNFDFLLQEVHPQSPFAGPLTSAPSASHKGCSSVDLQCHRGETSNQRAAVRSDHRGKMWNTLWWQMWRQRLEVCLYTGLTNCRMSRDRKQLVETQEIAVDVSHWTWTLKDRC